MHCRYGEGSGRDREWEGELEGRGDQDIFEVMWRGEIGEVHNVVELVGMVSNRVGHVTREHRSHGTPPQLTVSRDEEVGRLGYVSGWELSSKRVKHLLPRPPVTHSLPGRGLRLRQVPQQSERAREVRGVIEVPASHQRPSPRHQPAGERVIPPHGPPLCVHFGVVAHRRVGEGAALARG